ncbi:hypothetical protein DL769_010505 [Monosporascus sp. CRB-8-3]|nr:hypothetical protein DL769_010505 [Monosporascus sp. CRB-8-3]
MNTIKAIITATTLLPISPPSSRALPGRPLAEGNSDRHRTEAFARCVGGRGGGGLPQPQPQPQPQQEGPVAAPVVQQGGCAAGAPGLSA